MTMSKQSRRAQNAIKNDSNDVLSASEKTQTLPFFRKGKKKTSDTTSDAMPTGPFFFNKEERIVPAKDADPEVVRAFMETNPALGSASNPVPGQEKPAAKPTTPDSTDPTLATPAPIPTPVTVPTTSVSTEVNGVMNGPGYAYSAWDWETGQYILLTDIWAAKQISCGNYDPVKVWYRNGRIDHVLSNAEIKKYSPSVASFPTVARNF